jgi:phosphopantothenate synthetase
MPVPSLCNNDLIFILDNNIRNIPTLTSSAKDLKKFVREYLQKEVKDVSISTIYCSSYASLRPAARCPIFFGLT